CGSRYHTRNILCPPNRAMRRCRGTACRPRLGQLCSHPTKTCLIRERRNDMFHGSIVALVTPFRNGGLDERAVQSLGEWHLAEGIQGFVPVGTTGESPTLTHPEHERVIELCIETVGRRAPVIAGCGSNSTEEAISLTRHAKEAGADAALIVTPYYNKPTQEGLYLHFKAIADAVDLPIFIYTTPGRSIVDMSVDTMARLAKHRN